MHPGPLGDPLINALKGLLRLCELAAVRFPPATINFPIGPSPVSVAKPSVPPEIRKGYSKGGSQESHGAFEGPGAYQKIVDASIRPGNQIERMRARDSDDGGYSQGCN